MTVVAMSKGAKGERDHSAKYLHARLLISISFPESTVEGSNGLLKVILWPPHMCRGTALPHLHLHTIIIDEIFRRSQTFAQESVCEVVPVLTTFWLPWQNTWQEAMWRGKGLFWLAVGQDILHHAGRLSGRRGLWLVTLWQQSRSREKQMIVHSFVFLFKTGHQPVKRRLPWLRWVFSPLLT